MGRLRAALRALALVNPLPEAVLSGLDRVFTATEDADQIATLVYLLINPAARRAAVGGAGHLPLVLVRAGQRARAGRRRIGVHAARLARAAGAAHPGARPGRPAARR